NISEGELSKRLGEYHHSPSGRTWRLLSEDVKGIVQTFADWRAITTRKQALALFTLMDFAFLSEDIDWQASPWNRLRPDASQGARLASPPLREEEERAHRLASLLRDQSSFMSSRLESFVGRTKELAEITRQVALLKETGGYLMVTGQAGQGKSSIIAKLVE